MTENNIFSKFVLTYVRRGGEGRVRVGGGARQLFSFSFGSRVSEKLKDDSLMTALFY